MMIVKIATLANIEGLAALGSNINKVVTTNPLVTAVGLTSLKTAAADLFAQTISRELVVGKDGEASYFEKIDLQRVSVFFLYGALYLGAFQYFLFTSVYPRLFPLAQKFAQKPLRMKLKDPIGGFSVIKQVSIEALLHWPLLLVPLYYICQELVVTIVSASEHGESKGTMITNLRRSVRRKLRSNWWDDLKLCWLIWIPSSLCNFSTLPLEWQVPFTALVSFVYTFILSLRRGGCDAKSA